MSPRLRTGLIIALALAVPIIPFAIIGELPGERWLSRTDANALAFGLSGAGLLAADLLLPVPSSIVGSLLGARLGFLAGLAWCWGGLMLGALVGYGLGRGAGRLLPGRRDERPDAGLPQTPTLVTLFLSRPVPVLAEAAALAAGAGRIPLAPFLGVTAAGNLIYAAALTGNGAALLPGGLVGPGLLVPMLLPVAGWLIWQRRLRPARAQSLAGGAGDSAGEAAGTSAAVPDSDTR